MASLLLWVASSAARAAGVISAPKPWIKVGVGMALASSVALAVLVAGAGSLSSGMAPARIRELVDSTPGLVALSEVVALATALVGSAVGRRWILGGALLLVPVAEGFRAHPGAQAGAWGIVLVAVHLTAAAVWIGALLHVIRAAIALRRAGASAIPVGSNATKTPPA